MSLIRGTPAPDGSSLLVSRDYDDYRLDIYYCPFDRNRYAHFHLKEQSQGRVPDLHSRPHDLAAEIGQPPVKYWAVFDRQ